MAINRFETLPQSFHQRILWRDGFSCLISCDNPIADEFSLENYINGSHIWVSKTGFGVGVGVNPLKVQKLGWVDEALAKLNLKRNIRVFTRHYQVAMLLAEQPDLIATLPSRTAKLQVSNQRLVVLPPPFPIESFELKMAWSPLVHHNPGHQWMRKIIADACSD